MINTTIGKYKIIRSIGEGGMATVFEAEHVLLGTKVAIKVLNPILSANAQIRERFINEAKLMASLDHPNITKVIDFDDQPHQLSIVMEFLNGEDLNQKIKRRGPLNEKEILEIFSQALSAFQYAHEKGIVHRDIKPSNIFILPDGRIKILDFGIAKLFGQGNEMTQTGTQMGTPIYMSPEQVKADKSIDYRSDIYSLGVTMFYAINGKTPYNSDTDSQFDIFTKIVYEALPDFSIPSKFNEIVLKACQKDREERFQSCDEWNSILLKNQNNDQTTFDNTRQFNFVDNANLKSTPDQKKIDTSTNSAVKPEIKLLRPLTIMQIISFLFLLILFYLLRIFPFSYLLAMFSLFFMGLNLIALFFLFKKPNMIGHKVGLILFFLLILFLQYFMSVLFYSIGSEFLIGFNLFALFFLFKKLKMIGYKTGLNIFRIISSVFMLLWSIKIMLYHYEDYYFSLNVIDLIICSVYIVLEICFNIITLKKIKHYNNVEIK